MVKTMKLFLGHTSTRTFDVGKPTVTAKAKPMLTLSRARRSITLKGRKGNLSPKSFQLLSLLADAIVNGDGIVTNQQIEWHLWRKRNKPKTPVHDAIRNLRKSLAAIGGRAKYRKLVETRYTEGYILALPAETIQFIS